MRIQPKIRQGKLLQTPTEQIDVINPNQIKADSAHDIDMNAYVETRQVTILLSDIRGFSEISEAYCAEEVVRMLNRYFECMNRIIQKYNGQVDKFMGDSILAKFGLPEESERDVENAIACAIEMQLAMDVLNKRNEELGLPAIYHGIGLNTGKVVVSRLGSEIYSEETIIGEAVNLTSRIESHCLRGQVLVSRATLDSCHDYVEVGPPNRIEVKGAKEAISLYEIYQTEKPHAIKVPRRDGRKSPRVPLDVPISFQCLAGKLILPEKLTGRTRDVSYHGMLMVSDKELTPLSEIKLKVVLGVFEEETSDIFARIIKSDGQGGKFYSSMEFTFVDREGQAAIKQIVDRVLHAQ